MNLPSVSHRYVSKGPRVLPAIRSPFFNYTLRFVQAGLCDDVLFRRPAFHFVSGYMREPFSHNTPAPWSTLPIPVSAQIRASIFLFAPFRAVSIRFKLTKSVISPVFSLFQIGIEIAIYLTILRRRCSLWGSKFSSRLF